MDETTLQDKAQHGIELCRRGEWQRGVEILAMVADEKNAAAELPGLFYSYLGYGIARFDRRRLREGLALCEHGTKREFYQPENYVNLARTYLIANQRRKAIEAVVAGRQVDRRHPVLAQLHRELGIRRPPVLRFLDRDHFLNRLFGRLRHDWKSSAKAPKQAADED